MKYFEKDFILKAINEMGKVWNDSFLTCLCIHKELHLKDDSAKDCWHQINKDSLKNELAYYFDLYEKPIINLEKNEDNNLSIVFARQYETLIPQAEIYYLAAICLRKQGIPDNVNDAQSLKELLVREFCIPPHFCTRLKNSFDAFPTLIAKSSNKDVVETLLMQSGKDKAESLSLGPKKVLGDSAGLLGSAYFQTLYSKMNSEICLVSSVPEQYPIPRVDKTSIDWRARKELFSDWLAKNSTGTPEFRKHLVDILEYWLDKKIPGAGIGNLFRFTSREEYDKEKERIKKLSQYDDVNISDSNGRPRTALNHYSNFLTDLKSLNVIPTTSSKGTVTSADPFPTQIIYYGVPGCGKSYEVNKVINVELDKYGVTDKEYHKVRCVFHPEYCNADFVGQIYPYVKPDNGGVEYRFKPGPFAEIVRRAYRNPAEPFFLIIEEINRGNAAAIFGEMFQLLDRIRPEDGPEELSGNIYNTGWSSYGVTNIDVNAYVRQKSTDNPEKIEYDDSIPYGDKIKFINNTAVRLPPNLSIYATMNTNDQNVFTMDNAFQRRFKSKMIRNVLDENSAQYKTEIDDTGVCWGDFREWINEKILLPQTAVLKADDKCLGGWFITGEKINGVDKIKKEDFAEKVLKYLWDDVFKRNKSGEIFVKDDKVNSLSDLIDAFETSVGFESFEKIFKMNDVDKAKLQKQVNT